MKEIFGFGFIVLAFCFIVVCTYAIANGVGWMIGFYESRPQETTVNCTEESAEAFPGLPPPAPPPDAGIPRAHHKTEPRHEGSWAPFDYEKSETWAVLFTGQCVVCGKQNADGPLICYRQYTDEHGKVTCPVGVCHICKACWPKLTPAERFKRYVGVFDDEAELEHVKRHYYELVANAWSAANGKEQAAGRLPDWVEQYDVGTGK